MRSKPVFTTGLSDYKWGTYEVGSDGSSLELAFLSPRPKLDPISLAQFVTFYFRDYCMNVFDERSIEEHIAKALLNWVRLKESSLL